MTDLQSKGPRTRSRGIGVVAAALVLAASLAGCGPADTGLPRDTARQLQERVLGVSQSAAANDHPAALNTLAALEGDVTAAADGGHVSEERRQSIMASITAVRAELTAAIDAAAAVKAAEEVAAAAAAAEKVKAEAEAAAAAAATPEYTAPRVAAPAPAPSPPPPPPEQKKGNEGKGKNKNG